MVRFYLVPLLLVVLGFSAEALLVRRSGQPDKVPEKGEGGGEGGPPADACDIVTMSVRTNVGEPGRVEKVGDGYEATICADAPGFRVSAEPTEALFDAGYTCELRGVPSGVTDLEQMGKSEFEVTIWTVPKGESVNNLVNNKAVCEGGECKKLEAEGVDNLRKKVSVTVTRLGEEDSPDQCVPEGRNAAEDCGYSVSLEKQRQAAALNPGSGIAPPPEPEFLQKRGRKPGC